MNGLKNAKSARDSFNPLLKKLMATVPSTDGNGTPPSAKKSAKKAAGGKRKAEDTADGSPAKKTRGKRAKAKQDSYEEAASSDDAEAQDGPTKDVTPADDAIAATIEHESSDEEAAEE